MLVRCPRCSFEQPQDQYCARCGVDMQHFHHKSSFSFGRIFKHPASQILFALVVAFFVGQYLIQKTQIDSLQPLRLLRSALPSSGSTLKNNSATPSEDSTPETVHMLNSQASVNESAEESTDSNKVNLVKLRISYFEIFSRGKDQLIEESRRSGQFNQFGEQIAGFLPMKLQKLSGGTKEVKILQTEEIDLPPQGTKSWKLSLDQNAAYQLIFNLEQEELIADSLKTKLEINRIWPESADESSNSPSESSFPYRPELVKDGGFYILGLMPHHLGSEQEDALKAHPVFQILKSKSFQAGVSEFGVLIEWL